MRNIIISLAVVLLSLRVAHAQPRDDAYLSDLKETEFHVGRGGLGKGGQLGFDAGHHHTALVVQGASAEQLSESLSAYAPSRIVYTFDQPYATLRGFVGVALDPHAMAAVVDFKVKGDGKLLWDSKQLAHPFNPISFSVDISGITKLELIVECPTGHNTGCFSAWIAPCVSGTSDKSPTLSLSATGPGTMALSWAHSGTHSVRLERSHDGCTEWKQVVILPAATTTYEDNTLTANTTYYYRGARGVVHHYGPIVSSATNASADASADPSYLADQTETSAGGAINKGAFTFEMNTVPLIQGLLIGHALSMEEEDMTPMTLDYAIGGKYQVLVGSVVPIASKAPVPGKSGARTVVLRVLGDGRVLWQKRLTQGSSDPEPFHIPVAGVQKLQLFVNGEVEPAHAVWLEPQLLTVAPPAAKIPDNIPGITQ